MASFEGVLPEALRLANKGVTAFSIVAAIPDAVMKTHSSGLLQGETDIQNTPWQAVCVA